MEPKISIEPGAKPFQGLCHDMYKMFGGCYNEPQDPLQHPRGAHTPYGTAPQAQG